MKKVLLVIALLAFSYACSNLTLNYPAIVGGKGEIIKAHITAEEGEGLFIDLSTMFGENTERSFINAYKLATQRAGKTCRFTVSFDEKEIEGPSGGLNTFVGFYSSITDRRIPDILITGALDEKGDVLPVGGQYEKALEAKLEGFDGFVAVPADIHEYCKLKSLDSGSFKIYFVDDVDDVLSIMFNESNYSFSIEHLNPVEIPKEENPYNIEDFTPYYELIREEYEKSKKEDACHKEFYTIFDESIEKVLSKGYTYTAANFLFLETSSLRAGPQGILERINRVNACLNSIPKFNYTKEGLELQVGAVVRKYRAEYTIKEVKREFKESLTEEEKEELSKNVEQSYLWCLTAKSMINNAEKGEPVNVSEYKKLAKNVLNEIERNEVEILNRGGGSFIRLATRAYIDEDYVASYFLGLYALSYAKDNYVTSFKTFWGRVYASQAYYYKYSDPQTYERLMSLATLLEKGFISPGYAVLDEGKHWITIGMVFIGFILVILLSVRASKGGAYNGKRSKRVYKIKKRKRKH